MSSPSVSTRLSDQQQCASQGFVLGVSSVSHDNQVEHDDSQDEQTITISGDSQFEMSAESQLLLNMNEPTDPEPHPDPKPHPAATGQVNRPTPAQYGSIFSNVTASKRVARAVGSTQNNRDSEGRTARAIDPYEFDSESHDAPTGFVLRRKKRGRGETGDGVSGEGVCSEGEGVGGEGGRMSMHEVNGGESVNCVTSVTGGDGDGVVCGEVDEGGGEGGGGEEVETMETSQVDTNSDPVIENQLASFHAERSQALLPGTVSITATESSLSPSTHPHTSTPSQPPPIPHPSQQSTAVTSTTLHTPITHNLTPHISTNSPCTIPLFTPPQHLPFTSPTSRMTRHDLSEASRGYRTSGARYAVRHVHTYKHVVEVRVVSQEVYEGDEVVDGLNSVWQVSERVGACWV